MLCFPPSSFFSSAWPIFSSAPQIQHGSAYLDFFNFIKLAHCHPAECKQPCDCWNQPHPIALPVETQVKSITPIGIQCLNLHCNWTVQKQDNKLEPELQLQMNSSGEQLTGRRLVVIFKIRIGTFNTIFLHRKLWCMICPVIWLWKIQIDKLCVFILLQNPVM